MDKLKSIACKEKWQVVAVAVAFLLSMVYEVRL